jgi:ribosomal RNA assembly protein
MIELIRIPKERIKILAADRGKIKKEIEKITKTRIQINEGVDIKGEAIDVMTATNIVKAIGRGFDPDIAFELIDEEKTLYIITLEETDKTMKRIKSRLIGTGGRARKNIERLTNTNVCIYGKTVSIIGNYENVEKARAALEKLISGSMHKTVYKYLERK